MYKNEYQNDKSSYLIHHQYVYIYYIKQLNFHQEFPIYLHVQEIIAYGIEQFNFHQEFLIYLLYYKTYLYLKVW